MFNRNEQNKVGRPKLADTDLKKKSLIISAVSLIVVLILVGIGLVVLDVIPFKKMKGAVNCTSIPEALRQGGNHEYGFDDIKFYSAVVEAYGREVNDLQGWQQYTSTEYCDTITEEQLSTITALSSFTPNAIYSFNGIQYLTGLKTIETRSPIGINNINLSNNIQLEKLNISGSSGSSDLSNVDLSHNVLLKLLFLYDFNINNIDLSNNTALTSLYLRNNNLTSIDLSNNTALTTLDLSYNNISSIDLSNNTALTTLDLSYNNISSIDLSNNTALTYLYLKNNNLTSIDLNNNTSLHELYSSNNNISTIDLSKNINLSILELNNNNLSILDLNNNTNLKSLELNNNNLSSIDLSHNTELDWLYLNDNNLTNVDLSNNTKLQNLDLRNNKLKKVNLKNITNYNDFSWVLSNNKLDNVYVVKKSKDDLNVIFPEVSNATYLIEDESIINIEDNKIEGLKVGSTSYTVSYTKDSYNQKGTMNFTVNVIDFTSDKYEIDHVNKTIDCDNKRLEDIKTSDFEVTTGEIQIEGNKLNIVVEDEAVLTYELTNVKEEVPVEENNTTEEENKKVTTSTKTNGTTKPSETTKKTNKKASKGIITTNKEETTTTNVVVNKVVESKTTTIKENKNKSYPIIGIGVTLGLGILGFVIYKKHV